MGKDTHSKTRRTVLVVEDNDLNRELVRDTLEPTLDSLAARDGLEGLDVLARRHRDISLVLLDVFMPRCDGFEFLRRMRSDKRYDTIPVIVMTASDETDDELRCLELGANDFIVKPINVRIMLNRVNNTIRLRESAAIVNQLTWDVVTKLYSKEFFYRAMTDAFEHEEGAFDVVCCEVDSLQALNDRYGEDAGDEFLGKLAKRLMERLPHVVAGGRLSGSVFAFLLEHRGTDWDQALSGIADDISYAGFGVKLGVEERVDRTMTPLHVCSRAMSAIETLKHLNENAYALFDTKMHERQLLEQAIRENMETALAKSQFCVFYQPKHDIRTNRTGGAEALARWFHPTLGTISPGVFIPIFERNGFITKLDMFVWEEACRELRRCLDAGLPVVPISVNASRLELEDPGLPARFAAVADAYGVDHALLHVELTETAYTDSFELVKNTLLELKRLGFSTELDDFGSGYSALATLNTLPLDIMKLDMSIIRQASLLNDFRIVEASVRLAQLLGMHTVTEGVETVEEVEHLKRIGCDLIQGYYYSKPLTREEFEEYLAREC